MSINLNEIKGTTRVESESRDIINSNFQKIKEQIQAWFVWDIIQPDWTSVYTDSVENLILIEYPDWTYTAYKTWIIEEYDYEQERVSFDDTVSWTWDTDPDNDWEYFIDYWNYIVYSVDWRIEIKEGIPAMTWFPNRFENTNKFKNIAVDWTAWFYWTENNSNFIIDWTKRWKQYFHLSWGWTITMNFENIPRGSNIVYIIKLDNDTEIQKGSIQSGSITKLKGVWWFELPANFTAGEHFFILDVYWDSIYISYSWQAIEF